MNACARVDCVFSDIRCAFARGLAAFDQTTDNKGIHFFVAPGAASASSSAIALSAAAFASTCDLAVPLLTAFVPLKTRQRKPLGGVLWWCPYLRAIVLI